MPPMHPASAETILPTLVYIQTHLNGDLSLARVANQAGVSPTHFHRLFRAVIGETLKQYTQRLRLERAAFELKIRDASILAIALGTGYRSHETFSRVFKRQFGLTPQSYRQASGRLLDPIAAEPPGSRQMLNQFAAGYQLSDVRVQRLTPMPVAFMRHLGSYVDVDTTLYETLMAWAQQQGVYIGDNLLIGIGHDDPSITPAEKLRFDACIQVPGPFAADGRIGCQETPAGLFATATYVGPYGPVMEEAYGALVRQIMQLRGYRFVGLPALEIYRTTRITPDYELNETDIFLPVEKIG